MGEGPGMWKEAPERLPPPEILELLLLVSLGSQVHLLNIYRVSL
jgi:hypothetical protein